MKTDFPRKIFSYWHQGVDKAPTIVKSCIRRLSSVNPDWDVIVLDEETVRAYVPELNVSASKLARMSVAHRSDLIRTKLLIDNGGVWIDPTVFVTQALEHWLGAHMQAGVFFFSRPGRDRLISNWFIAAEAGNPVLSRLYSELCVYWESNDFRNLGRRPTLLESMLFRILNRNETLPGLWLTWPFTKVVRICPYMIYHYVLAQVVKKDNALNGVFSKMPMISATGPHKLQRFGLLNTYDSEAAEILADSRIPVHKLSWKVAPKAIPDGCVLSHLIEKATV